MGAVSCLPAPDCTQSRVSRVVHLFTQAHGKVTALTLESAILTLAVIHQAP